jgi:hypothetical protein
LGELGWQKTKLLVSWMKISTLSSFNPFQVLWLGAGSSERELCLVAWHFSTPPFRMLCTSLCSLPTAHSFKMKKAVKTTAESCMFAIWWNYMVIICEMYSVS